MSVLDLEQWEVEWVEVEEMGWERTGERMFLGCWGNGMPRLRRRLRGLGGMLRGWRDGGFGREGDKEMK